MEAITTHFISDMEELGLMVLSFQNLTGLLQYPLWMNTVRYWDLSLIMGTLMFRMWLWRILLLHQQHKRRQRKWNAHFIQKFKSWWTLFAIWRILKNQLLKSDLTLKRCLLDNWQTTQSREEHLSLNWLKMQSKEKQTLHNWQH